MEDIFPFPDDKSSEKYMSPHHFRRCVIRHFPNKLGVSQ
ncbi:hypothetical protein C7S16_4133 [Burkholderia thailandensis]|uniref:Uncharacterized protein n=1 Tax=Burkholderia thailandensis TaxID=57975 RepID=A0AAW9D6S9_BURTH|nr:hypothetical protein [Burkholderia thailandensis]